MSSFRKFFISGFLIVTLLIAGFIFLLKGCLAKYDERSAVLPALYFKKDGNQVIFSIVKFDKATSYSSNGGFVRKTVTSSYDIQSNDASSGNRLLTERLKEHGDIKSYPIEAIGAANGQAWLYMGELMAFDPFTLKKIADKNIIEQKNPAVKGKMPSERSFYAFNEADNNVYFTATDGIKWKLDTKTLSVTENKSDPEASPIKMQMDLLKTQQEENQQAQMDLNKNFHPTDAFFKSRDALYKKRDSLQKQYSMLQQKELADRQLRSAIENFRTHSTSFNQIKTNQDTVNSKWFGLYSPEEINKLYERVQKQSAYDLTARRSFIVSSYSPISYGGFLINKKESRVQSNGVFFLQGGFLLDKSTALPIHLGEPEGFLVVSKEKIGNDSEIILSRLSANGREEWRTKTGLKEWLDWIYTGDHLIVFGADKKELSGEEANKMLIIQLKTGSTNIYDFFTDKR
ncbi:MAG: hypothetical protein H7Y27_14160 [Gemmatimonadaceae bacterium]|nr:hypothetical protein [Chitinophagaceae bacterium]